MTDPFIPITPRAFQSDRELLEWTRRVHTMLEDLARDVRALQETQTSIVTNFNALLAKLDADAGVADTNYVATLGL